MNVAVLLSGGVDSAVVVHRLKEQGIDPTLFYIRIGMDNDEGDCSAEEDIEMCIYIARKYGLPFEVVSLHRGILGPCHGICFANGETRINP